MLEIDTDRIITISEANRSFSRAARLADIHGEAFIFENDRPRYKLIDLEGKPELELSDDEKIDIVVMRILKRFKPAFMELAK